MKKARVHLLLGINTLVIYVLIVFFLRQEDPQQWLVIGIAMAIMWIVSSLIIKRALAAEGERADAVEDELVTTRVELVQIREKYASVTTLDELTGSYNERFFHDVLLQHSAMSIRGNYEFTVAVMQVDQFAHIVDEHGLGSANEALQLFSRIVKAALREVDVLARLGSDTFGILLSGASEDGAVLLINRISQLISQIQIQGDLELKVTASGGITLFHGTETPDELIAHANKALEFAVEQGRDRVAGYLYTAPAADKEPAADKAPAADEAPAADKEPSAD